MPVSLSSVAKKVVGNENGFTKCKSCLTKLIAFCDEVTDVQDKFPQHFFEIMWCFLKSIISNELQNETDVKIEEPQRSEYAP